MITRFTAKNLKAFADVSTTLAPLTVVVGVNGAGKSTLLDGLDWTLQLNRPCPDRLGAAARVFQGEFGIADVLRRPEAFEMILGVEYSDSASFTAVLVCDAERKLQAVRLVRGDGMKLVYPVGADERQVAEADFFSEPDLLALGTARRLRLNTDALALPTVASTEKPRMREDGDGLATLLQHLAGERDGRLDAIESDLRKLVPDFRRVRTRPTRIERLETEVLRIDGQAIERQVKRPVPGHALLLEFDGPGAVPARHSSEGTLLALGLLTALHAEPTRLLLIDDAGQALHPAAEQALIGLIRAVQADRPDLQVVMTTHSPDLVDVCTADEVRVVGRGPDGAARIASLRDHPEAAKWLELLRVGEFWSTVGEDWLGKTQG